jgi:Right handed beta helix region
MTKVPAATTWTVCASGCDYSSIKAAIAAPTTLDGDTLAIAAGTYTEAGILVSKSLILQGAGAASTIVQAAATQGTASDRVFSISSGVTVTLRELTIQYGSILSSYGGGLYNAGKLTLTNSTISDNTAFAGGGLFNNSNSTLTLTNSTISGNTATYGGGLLNEGTLTLTHSTISGNAATYGGGLLNADPLTLANSIVAKNQGGDCDNVTGGSITSQGYNLDSDGSCHLTAPTDLPGKDPLLGPLQKNGGPTFTQALLPGSTAIDAIPWGTNGCGTTILSDQRWQARPQALEGACDIGAYEVAVAGQPLSGWVTGFTPHTVICENGTTGQAVTLSGPAPSWDCEAASLRATPGDHVTMRVRGPIEQGATDVGGAVAGMAPSGGGCTNLATGQQVPFQALFQGIPGATAASCVAAGLVVHPGDTVQMSVQGSAE